MLIWSNSKITYRSTSKDSNNNISSLSTSDLVETELHSTEPVDKSAEVFLNAYKNTEERHPELPLVFIRGLYYYLEQVKRQFVADKEPRSSLESFEHTRIVQTIVKSIATSSDENRWVTVNY